MAKSDPPDIDATNRDFIHFEQVEKQQDYRLAEGREGEEQFDEEFVVRTCNLADGLSDDPARRGAFAQELGTALEEIGFAILVGHGIDPDLYAEADAHVRRMFSETPLSEKLRFGASRFGSVNQGYFPIKQTAEIHPDLVEGWVFCRRAFGLDTDTATSGPKLADFWPDLAAEGFFRELCRAHLELVAPIMQAMLTHLGNDPHLYDARLRGTNFGLRLNYYPPIADADDASGAGRLLGHEDVNLFTILPAPSVEGLQVLNRKNDKWIRLVAPPGSIILNTGDYMQRISNDLFPSTTHRVSKPRDPELRRQGRTSFPMNVYLWEDELLEVLDGLGSKKYPPVTALAFHTSTTSKYYGADYAVDEGEVNESE